MVAQTFALGLWEHATMVIIFIFSWQLSNMTTRRREKIKNEKNRKHYHFGGRNLILFAIFPRPYGSALFYIATAKCVSYFATRKSTSSGDCARLCAAFCVRSCKRHKGRAFSKNNTTGALATNPRASIRYGQCTNVPAGHTGHHPAKLHESIHPAGLQRRHVGQVPEPFPPGVGE